MENFIKHGDMYFNLSHVMAISHKKDDICIVLDDGAIICNNKNILADYELESVLKEKTNLFTLNSKFL